VRAAQQQQEAAAAATHRSKVSDLAFAAASSKSICVRCSPEEMTRGVDAARRRRSGSGAAAPPRRVVTRLELI